MPVHGAANTSGIRGAAEEGSAGRRQKCSPRQQRRHFAYVRQVRVRRPISESPPRGKAGSRSARACTAGSHRRVGRCVPFPRARVQPGSAGRTKENLLPQNAAEEPAARQAERRASRWRTCAAARNARKRSQVSIPQKEPAASTAALPARPQTTVRQKMRPSRRGSKGPSAARFRQPQPAGPVFLHPLHYTGEAAGAYSHAAG